MHFTPISSTNISGAALDGSDLYLEFVKGGIYRYADVPEGVFKDFLASPSAGKFFHAEIKDKYPVTKIDAFSN